MEVSRSVINHHVNHHSKGLFERGESKTAIAQRVVDLWNSTVTRLPKVKELTDAREKHIRARLKDRTPEQLGELFRRLDSSDLAASGGWATFDWIMKSATNAAKVDEGHYDNKPAFNGTASAPELRSADELLEERKAAQRRELLL